MQNTYPLTKISDTEFIEGYWFTSYDSGIEYPHPLPSNSNVCPIFLNKLKLVSHNSQELHYNGYSFCRLCGCKNGTIEFSLSSQGVTFRYPIGLFHYYEEHNVQPSKEFNDFIINF